MLKHATLTAGLVAASLALPLVADAHHSFAAEFDSSKVVHLDGTVVQFSWVNPHSWIYMDVKKPDGTVEHWKIEGGAPSLLLRRGWNKNSVQPGVRVVVVGRLAVAQDGTVVAVSRPEGGTTMRLTLRCATTEG